MTLKTRLARLEAKQAAATAKLPPDPERDSLPLSFYRRFIEGEQVPELADLEPYRSVIEDLVAGKLGGPENAAVSH